MNINKAKSNAFKYTEEKICSEYQRVIKKENGREFEVVLTEGIGSGSAHCHINVEILSDNSIDCTYFIDWRDDKKFLIFTEMYSDIEALIVDVNQLLGEVMTQGFGAFMALFNNIQKISDENKNIQ